MVMFRHVKHLNETSWHTDFFIKLEGTQAADDRTTQWGDEERTQVGTKPTEPELSEEDLAHKLAIDLRCVTLCVGMLERVNSVGTKRRYV
jgi:hypothetical protein